MSTGHCFKSLARGVMVLSPLRKGKTNPRKGPHILHFGAEIWKRKGLLQSGGEKVLQCSESTGMFCLNLW